MRVLVTGATGLVGGHTAACVHRAGHEVRLLVRDPAHIGRALPLGVEEPAFEIGDVVDERAVERALRGCEAAIHCAGLVSFDPRRRRELERTNVEGSRVLLEAAHRAGVDPIIFVSSLVVLSPGEDGIPGTESSLKRPQGVYGRSKAAAEEIARRMQEKGAPLTITYPSAVVGPNRPTLGAVERALLGQLQTGWGVVLPSGVSIVDVRDLAALHVALLSPGKGARRYTIGGHFLPYADLTETVARLTGRRIRKLRVPGSVARAMGALGSLVQRIVRIDLGDLNYEATALATRGVAFDDSRALAELGLTLRPIEDTLRDTFAWILEAGMCQPEHLGRLANGVPAAQASSREPAEVRGDVLLRR